MGKAVQFGCVIKLPAGTSTLSPPECAPVVPADKKLVIEFITVRATMPKGQIPYVLLQTSAAKLGAPGTIQNNWQIAFNCGPLSATGVTDEYFATHLVKMQAMPGDDIGLSVSRNSTTGEATFAINYGGQLMNKL
jgi:hypothetical protein